VAPAIDPRDQRIADLEAKVAWLMERVAKLEAENAELRAQLRQNSQNSSKPPSSDPPGASRPAKDPTGRAPGGQPGHKGHKRERLEPDVVVALRPEKCGGCGRRLRGSDPAPRRHQVVEIPPVKPYVTEYEIHELGCACGERTRAELPAGVPAGGFGPRLTAMAAVCTGKYRMPKRAVQELFADFFGLTVGLGTISKLERRVSEALATPVDEARAFVRAQPVIHPDETGWREHGQKRWLWTAATDQVSVFHIDRSRGSVVAKALIGEDFAGTLVSDRWSAYAWVDASRRQLCWAHLIREFRGFEERDFLSMGFGESLLAEAKKMFRWWARVRDGTMSRVVFQRKMVKVEGAVGRLLRAAQVCSDERTGATCRDILRFEPALWTFVRIDGVEPTNNLAERALRTAVIWRKSSFGTWSAAGSTFVARILTTIGSLKQQGRHALAFVTEALLAAAHRREPPSLLPYGA
jgi:transposase